MARVTRRNFIRTGLGVTAASWLGRTKNMAAEARPTGTENALCVVSSGNGIRATEKAMELMRAGSDPLDAVIAGVNIVEEDPNDASVGYGGVPNEDGVVELDASVMYGPSHAAGAVASLRNIKTPSRVASETGKKRASS